MNSNRLEALRIDRKALHDRLKAMNDR